MTQWINFLADSYFCICLQAQILGYWYFIWCTGPVEELINGTTHRIPDSQLNASSVYDFNYSPGYSRLNTCPPDRLDNCCWSALEGKGEFIEVRSQPTESLIKVHRKTKKGVTGSLQGGNSMSSRGHKKVITNYRDILDRSHWGQFKVDQVGSNFNSEFNSSISRMISFPKQSYRIGIYRGG